MEKKEAKDHTKITSIYFNDLYFINFNKNDKFKFLLKKNNFLDFLKLKRFCFLEIKKRFFYF